MSIAARRGKNDAVLAFRCRGADVALQHVVGDACRVAGERIAEATAAAGAGAERVTSRAAAGPGFWRTVAILLGAARRRTAGRARRRAELLRKRGAALTGFAPAFGIIALGFFAILVHVIAAIDLTVAISTADDLAERGVASSSLAALVAVAVLALWAVMLVCQGEGVETDTQRARQPMWEWLFQPTRRRPPRSSSPS